MRPFFEKRAYIDTLTIKSEKYVDIQERWCVGAKTTLRCIASMGLVLKTSLQFIEIILPHASSESC